MRNNLVKKIAIKRVIITGYTGAVGTALIKEMVKNNIQVIAVCRPSSNNPTEIQSEKLVSIIECDLSKLKNLPKLIKQKCDVFYHFAWDGTHGDPRNDIFKQNLNVKYSLDAVISAKELGCKVFIGAGSQAEYGHVDGTISSFSACNPENSYGAAKLSAGNMTRILCKQLGIRHEWCRIVSLFGPNDREYTMIMSSLLKMMNSERVSFTKAEQTWDYIYNMDAARAFRLVAERGRDGSVYCFGSGKSRKLKDYIISMRDIVNPKLEVGIGEIDYYPGQVMNLDIDISNLTKDTGFKPQYSFEDGILETIEWIRNNKMVSQK